MSCHCHISCGLSCILVFASVFSFIELAFGAHYLGKGGCDDSTLIEPSVWLIIMGSVNIFSYLSAIIRSCSENDFIQVFHFIVTVLSVMFNIAWTIIGGVVLWRDNFDCAPSKMHDFIWSSVIINIIGLAVFAGFMIMPNMHKN
jgi:hypothetical protein